MELGKGIYFLTSAPGILKIFEFITLLISLACISGFINSLHNSRGTWNFFVFSVAATWILTMISALFFTLGAHQKFPSINWVLAMAIIYFIFTVMLLVAAGILADNTRSYKTSGLCDSWKFVRGDIECNHLVVSVVFAFLAFFLYSLDTVFHFWLNLVAQSADTNEDEAAEMEP